MCGRIVLSSSPRVLAEMFHLDALPDLEARYNIAPMSDIAAVVRHPGADGLALRMMRWGLVPSLAKEASMGGRMINARSETVADKPAFRDAFTRRRCLIPVDGFYEWKKIPGGKQPFFFQGRDALPLALAGLWDTWPDPKGGQLETCTIMTTAANRTMAPVHNRMPVILPAGDRELWLDLDTDKKDQLMTLLRPCDDDLLALHPVTPRVGRPTFDEPACLDPVEMPDEPDQMDLF
jgi:putative SOS response-associated peptidase YedK